MSRDFDVVTDVQDDRPRVCCGAPATCWSTYPCAHRAAYRAAAKNTDPVSDQLQDTKQSIPYIPTLTSAAIKAGYSQDFAEITPASLGLSSAPAHITTDSLARKEAPIYSGVLKYFPKAMAAVARLSKIGNDKHNPGEPLHWSREKSSDHGDCIVRHQIDAGTIDTDGRLHDEKVAWRALAQLELAIEKLHAAGIDY